MPLLRGFGVSLAVYVVASTGVATVLDIDLIMLAVTTGRERTEQQCRALLDSAGCTLDRVVDTPAPCSILEATLR